MKEKFKLISDYCKYSDIGREDGEWVSICRKESQIPKGKSWNRCNIKLCPLLRIINIIKN